MDLLPGQLEVRPARPHETNLRIFVTFLFVPSHWNGFGFLSLQPLHRPKARHDGALIWAHRVQAADEYTRYREPDDSRQKPEEQHPAPPN